MLDSEGASSLIPDAQRSRSVVQNQNQNQTALDAMTALTQLVEAEAKQTRSEFDPTSLGKKMLKQLVILANPLVLSMWETWGEVDEFRIAIVTPFPLVREFLKMLRNDRVPSGLAALKEGLAEQQKMDAGQQ